MAVSLAPDAQAIALVCSSLALEDSRAVKPLTPTEWHDLTVKLRQSQVERPRELLGCSAVQLEGALGISPSMGERLEQLLARGGQLALALERLASQGIWVLTRADEAYPLLLKQRLRGQAPPLLFGAGRQDRLNAAAIAVVGSRDVDDDGLEFADAFGRRCARQAFAVVSGGARGVDATAMQGAIDAGGVAIGITVDPLERLVRRRDLRVALSEGSLVLATPFHPAARWHAGNAMRRNRLIYAMARAAVVVASTPERGGTRAGAIENLKVDWVPLHVRDDGSPGNRELIGKGGHALAAGDVGSIEVSDLLVSATRDAPERKSPNGSASAIPSLAATRTLRDDDLFPAVWRALAPYLSEPRSVNDVADHFDLVATQARAWLARAERADLVRVQARPKRYVIAGREQEPLFSVTESLT